MCLCHVVYKWCEGSFPIEGAVVVKQRQREAMPEETSFVQMKCFSVKCLIQLLTTLWKICGTQRGSGGGGCVGGGDEVHKKKKKKL